MGNYTTYTYERNCTADDYMSVIVFAIYRYDYGYYKVVMTDDNGTPLNIIRNHQYILTIVGVNAPGYRTLEDAMTSPPSNALKVEITNDDTDFPFIVSDGQTILALSNNEFYQHGRVYRGSGYDWLGIHYPPPHLKILNPVKYG